MPRYNIDNPLSDDGRNKLNTMFEELYNKYTGAGLNASEAREKALSAVMKSDEAMALSERLQKELTEAILAGDSSPLGGQLSVGADGTVYPGPQERLVNEMNSVRSDLAQIDDKKANRNEIMTQTEFDSWVSTLLDGGPSIFYETLVALETDYPEGASGVALVRETDPARIYVWNGTKWEDFGAYQGIELKDKTVTTEKLATGAVTPIETSFAKKGKNLFSGHYVNAIISGPQGEGIFKTRTGALSTITPVKKNETYYISFSPESTNDRFRIATSVGYPVDGGKVNFTRNIDHLNNALLTLEGDEDHIIVYLASSENGIPPIDFQIEQGDTQTEYESPSKVIIDFVKSGIPTEAVDNIRPVGILSGSGTAFDVRLSEERIVTSSTGGYINVGNKRYNMPEGVWSFSDFPFQTVIICFNPTNQTIEFLGSSEINESQNVMKPLIGLIRRDSEEIQINGMYKLDGRFVKPYTEEGNNTSSKRKLFIADQVSGYYKANPPSFNVYTRDILKVYEILDALVVEFPDYVTKTFLRNDEAGLPINRYDFKPTELESGTFFPKIITTCTHGHEVHATYGMAFFFEELARNWKSKGVLRMLRWNIHFIYIPNLNPYGFNNGQRPNYNGIDLARNFSAGWSPEYTDINYNYPGTEPLSEVGTQIMDEILRSNQDALFVLDNHNFGGDPSNGGQLLYISSAKGDSLKIGEQHVRLVGTLAKTEGYVDPGKVVGEVKTSPAGGSLTRQVASYGLEGMLLESTSVLNGEVNTQELLGFNMDSVGNSFLTVLRYFAS